MLFQKIALSVGCYAAGVLPSFLRMSLNLDSVARKDQFTLVSARHKAAAPVACAIENLNYVLRGSVVSFNPRGVCSHLFVPDGVLMCCHFVYTDNLPC